MPEAPNVYKSKKDAQDAHEAIRPTSVLRTPESLANVLAEDELKLYRLIWMRFIASQMTPAVFDQTTIDVTAEGQGRQRVSFPRHRHRAEVRRLSCGLRRRQRSEGRRRRGTEAQASGRRRRRGAAVQRRSSRSSTSPSRRRASTKRRLSRSWKRTASAGPRPMPPSCPRFRNAST